MYVLQQVPPKDMLILTLVEGLDLTHSDKVDDPCLLSGDRCTECAFLFSFWSI